MTGLSRDPYNLVITGVGGQGNVLISQILARALISAGYKTAVGETFGLSQRGGSVQSHVRASRDRVYGPLIAGGGAQAVLGLEPLETLRVLPQYGAPDTIVIVNSRRAPPLNVIAGEAVYPAEEELQAALSELAARVYWINATAAAQEMGAAVMANIVSLGALAAAGLLPLGPEMYEEAMAQSIPAARLDMNLKAFRAGLDLTASAGRSG
jgi:indolepyruvate ferredoxin oxidoreductase beta subunit